MKYYILDLSPHNSLD
ncbi:hypothetical protein CQA20_29660 [Klebsiella pneumoniae]|nr:hypothetical protein CQA20_29660 [Klebsiella pneumoniae]